MLQGTGICGSRADTQPGRKPEATANPVPAARASCTRKSDPADPKQLGSAHRRQPSEGLWLLRSLGSRGHTCPGQHHSSTAPAQLTPFQEVCVEHSRTNVRHPPARRRLSRPHTPESRHSSPVLVSFRPPSPVGPVLEPEPHHVTPATPPRCPRPSLSLDAPPTQLPPLSWGLWPANGPKTRLSRGPGSAPRQGPSGEQAAWVPHTPPGLPPGPPALATPASHSLVAPTRLPEASSAVTGQVRRNRQPPHS